MDITRNVLLIRITKSYGELLEKGEAITDEQVYGCVRGRWDLCKERAEGVDYIFAVYNNVIVGVYSAAAWHDCDENDSAVNPNWVGEEPNRIYFTRHEKPSFEEILIRGLCVNKPVDVEMHRNPLFYVTLTYGVGVENGFCMSPAE